MTKKTGIWIDGKKAIVVKLINDATTMNVIDSGIEKRPREAGENKKFGRFGKYFFSFENKKKRKDAEHERQFFKKIIKEMSETEDLVLFGPSSVKKHLEKEIQSDKRLKINIKGVVDADSMTENQITAWVSQYFKNEEK